MNRCPVCSKPLTVKEDAEITSKLSADESGGNIALIIRSVVARWKSCQSCKFLEPVYIVCKNDVIQIDHEQKT